LISIVREYIPEDREACIAAFKSNVPKYFTEDEVRDFEKFLTRIESTEQKQQIKTLYYVVLHDNKVVGCGGFGDKDGRRVITLAWGLMHKNYHKKGFGKKLLLHRLREIERHFPGLPLVVDTTQHTYKFFESFGFIVTKVTNDFYAPGLHRYDMDFVKAK
jgi:N-acetylglutamate synthase-like GNAT family acetyltransferase